MMSSSILNISLSVSGSVAISQIFQDKSERYWYLRKYDHLVFPAKGGNALVTLKYQDAPYWCVLLNVSDTWIPETIIEGELELDIVIRKVFPERHFMLARANRLILKYQETREEMEHKVISDKIRIAPNILFSETEKLTYRRTYNIVFDVLANQKTEELLSEELVRTEKSTYLEFVEVEIDNSLDDVSLLKKYSKYDINEILRHMLFSKYIIHKNIHQYKTYYTAKGKTYEKIARYYEHYKYDPIHQIHRLDRELTIDDILELSKAYVIVLQHIAIPIRDLNQRLHIHKVAYNGQIFYIYADQYIFSDETILARRRSLALSEYYKKLFPKEIYVDKSNLIFDVLEKLRKTRLKYNTLSPLEQLYEMFYERRPREKKRKYFEGYFELFNKVFEINRGKARLIISFPNAHRFRVFKIQKTKKGYIKVRAMRGASRIPSQLWIRGKFLHEYIRSNNLQDYIHFIFKSRKEKLEILRKYFRQLYTYLSINPVNLSDLDWKTFEGMMDDMLPSIPFLSAIHEYFVAIKKETLYPRYAKKDEIIKAYDRFLFAIKNNKPEKLLEPEILKWIRNAIKYYLIMKHNVKPKAGLVLSGDPYEILRKIFEKVKNIRDKEFALLVANNMIELEICNELREKDKETDKEIQSIISRLEMDLILE